jgi:hypothetical protein
METTTYHLPLGMKIFVQWGDVKQSEEIQQKITNLFGKQPEKEKMKQIMTLDLNVLDLCTIDQLSEVEALIAKIKSKKTINHNQAIKEEQKKAKKQEIEAKHKAYDAVQERINEQEKWINNQRILLTKISDDYKRLRKEYNDEFQQGIGNKTI